MRKHPRVHWNFQPRENLSGILLSFFFLGGKWELYKSEKDIKVKYSMTDKFNNIRVTGNLS